MSIRTKDNNVVTKRLLRNVRAIATSGWIWVGGKNATITINGTFVGNVTVLADAAAEDGPASDAGPVLGTTTIPAIFITGYGVNWVRLNVDAYTSGAVNADVVAIPVG